MSFKNTGAAVYAKGPVYDQARFTYNTGNNTWALAEDCGSGKILSITRNSTGNYTVQLGTPYDPKIVTCTATLSATTNTETATVMRYQTGSYNATTGQFVIFGSTSAGTAAQDPQVNGCEMHIEIVYRRTNQGF